MSKNINISRILKKHSHNVVDENSDWGDNTYQALTIESAKAAIKEIIEAVVDKCAEEAKIKMIEHGQWAGEVDGINKQSIQNVKTMIEY